MTDIADQDLVVIPDAQPEPSPADAAIRLVGLTKSFGGKTVVDHLDLDIRKGEFFSLLGPSGCGKTTTLRMIAGFSDATEGSILLGGQDVTSTPPHRRNVNTVFQSYALFEHLDVAGNVGFGLRRKKLDKATIARQVGEALELVQLGDRAKAKPRELSGGQKQRVALARALVNRPEVLLLDEPLAALDLKLRHRMQVELKAIQREVGITFVFVTHDQDEALTMSDRVAIMNNGVIEQCGTPEDVYERPRTAFAAGFIGTSNLMTGTLSGGSLELAPGVRVPVPGHDDLADGSTLSVAVRPEKIWMYDLQPSMVRVAGTVAATVYHGATTQYLVDVAPGVRLTVLEQNLSRARNEDRWSDGDRVELGWQPEHAVVIR
ncbi:MAG: ABC transporter ATP-binding protein [Candidatus Nanopelagicales bacterium]